MPRVKMPRKSTHVDMTAMCDVAFLLLTFFMLTTKFKPVEPVTVVTPSSISTKLLPESDVIMITISKDGRVFFSLDNRQKRIQLMKNFDDQYHLGLTPDEINKYANGSSTGLPIHNIKAFLDLSDEQRGQFKQPGIPLGDSAKDVRNELDQWIKYSLNVNNGNGKLAFVVKADNETKYPVVKEVLQTLKDNGQQKLHLITEIKPIPPNTAAWREEHASSGKK